MEKNISRRDSLKAIGGLSMLMLTGACAVLPTNTINNFKEGYVCTNEDLIRMKRIGILGEWYFAIPLNNENRILDGGEPSFALIPESRSRVKIKKVGEKGGEVIVDAPKGDLYLPYVLKTNGNAHELITNFSNIIPVRLRTNFEIEELEKPDSKYGKIRIEKITGKEFPFIDETLNSMNGNFYVINRTKPKDIQSINGENYNVLGMCFTKLPFEAEYNQTDECKKINILGQTYMFKKGETIESYSKNRGCINPLEIKLKKERKEKQTKHQQRIKNQTIEINPMQTTVEN